MSQYYIKTNTKQPQFFSFNRVLQNLESGLDYEKLLKEFQENFDKEEQDRWSNFWNIQGEDIILKTWNEKYRDYLPADIEEKEAQDYNNLENKEDITKNLKEEEEVHQINQALEISEVVTSTNQQEIHSKSWQDLWDEHREEIYLKQYLIYSSLFSNYFFDLKNSLTVEDSKLLEDFEQLKLLGLPTSFGGVIQHSRKKPKTTNQRNYTDFFSDSEMENESSDSDIEEKSVDISSSINVNDDASLHILKNKIIKKSQKKKNRKLKNVPTFMLAEKGLLKYWRKRFSLFSRFDEGIRLDRESWFSVTPEKVAKHLADRLQCSIIVDGFCGSGGNSIQFALTCQKVIAIDIDPVKLEMAKHNAEIYEVSHKIEFILGDFLQIAAGGKLKADTVFLSPPWGGPKYKNKINFDIEKYLLPVKASELVETSRDISENIALFLPRNSNVKQIVQLAGVGKRCEIEHNYLDSRLVAITALYGEEILKKT